MYVPRDAYKFSNIGARNNYEKIAHYYQTHNG